MSEIQEQLQTNIDTGAIVTIHDVMTQPLADGWAVDAGWYQLNASDAGDPVRYGNSTAADLDSAGHLFGHLPPGSIRDL